MMVFCGVFVVDLWCFVVLGVRVFCFGKTSWFLDNIFTGLLLLSPAGRVKLVGQLIVRRGKALN
jgi:hypothetical protein